MKKKRPPPRSEGGAGRLEDLALGLGSGILVALPFIQPGLFWLHTVALVPWIVLLTRPRRRWTWGFFLLGVCGFLAIAFGPFSTLSKVVPVTALVCLGPLMLPFALILRGVATRRAVPLVLLVPVAWVLAEYVRARFSLGNFGELYPLAAAQTRLTPLIQVADLTGLYGVSFLVAATNGAAVDGWRLWRAGQRRRAAIPVLAAVALFAAAWGYGVTRLETLRVDERGPRIAVIQPNEVHYRDPAKTRGIFDRQLALVRSAVAPGAADLIALPENAVDYPWSADPYYAYGLGKLARERRAPVLAGAFSWASEAEETLHTSAYYLDAEGELLGRYDKLYLIPWAEYLPFGWLGESIQRRHAELVRRAIGYFAPGVHGRELAVFPLEHGGATLRFATPICYEIAHPVFVRRAVAAGADFLVNLSSEGLFGAPLYRHMWALASLRAVESRVAIVRVGNNGISGFIDPAGRTRSVVRGDETGRPWLETGTLIDRVPLAGPPGSVYSRRGDLFAWLCAAVAVGLLVWSLLPRIRARASSRP